MTLKKYREYIDKRLEIIQSQIEELLDYEKTNDLYKQHDYCMKELMLIDAGAYGKLDETE